MTSFICQTHKAVLPRRYAIVASTCKQTLSAQKETQMTHKTLEEFLFGEEGVARLVHEKQYEGEQFPEVARTMN